MRTTTTKNIETTESYNVISSKTKQNFSYLNNDIEYQMTFK